MNIHELEKIAAGWDDAWERQDNDACGVALAAARRMQKHICNNFMRALAALKEMQETIRCIAKACPPCHKDENTNTACALIHSYCHCASQDVHKLLAELEEVKT